MYGIEIFLHKVNLETNEIEVVDFNLPGVRKRFTVSKETAIDAKNALSQNKNEPVIMMFDKDNLCFIHQKIYD